MRRRQNHRAIVEQVLAERNELCTQRLLREDRAEAGAIDEDVALDPCPVLAEERGDLGLGILLHIGHPEGPVQYAAFGRPVAQEVPQLVRIEVVAVTWHEGEVVPRVRAPVFFRQDLGEKPVVGMGGHIETPPAKLAIMHETRFCMQVDGPREGMEIALETRPLAPAGKADTQLVGGIARGHPVGLVDAEMVEESFQLRSRSLSDTDYPDFGAFDDGDLSAARMPAVVQQAGGDPARAAPTQHYHVWRFPFCHPSIGTSRTAKPPPGAMRRSRRSVAVRSRCSMTISKRVGPSKCAVAASR